MADAEAASGTESAKSGGGARSRSWIGLWVVIAIVAVAAAGAAWFFYRPSREVVFAELLYQQSFAPLEAGLAPSAPYPRNGYLYLPASRELHSAIGREIPPRSGFVAGLGLHFVAVHPPRDLARTLRAAEAGGVSWATGEKSGLPSPNLSFALRLDLPVELAAEGQSCRVQVGDATRRLAFGERDVVHEGSRSYTLDEYIDALRRIQPAMEVPQAEARERLARVVDPDGDGVVMLYARAVATCHGEVSLFRADLLSLWREARRAAREGRFDAAKAALADYLEVVPEDRDARRLLDEVEADLAEGRILRRLSGRVSFSAGAERAREPALVSVREAGAPREAIAGQIFAVDGSFEFHLPPGDYEVECAPRGYRAQRIRVHLEGAKEADCAFGAADRR